MRPKLIILDIEGHTYSSKEKYPQEDIAILNMYLSSKRVPKFLKETQGSI